MHMHSMWPSQSAPYLRSLPRMLSHRMICNSIAASGDLTRKPSHAPTHDTSKRKAGLHVAYVGTNYIGLQMQQAQTEHTAIENVLHNAIFEAGMMLSSNKDNPQRLKWSRSSRTDRGVHSLGTVRCASCCAFVCMCCIHEHHAQVITCMLEVDKHAFEFDPRGLCLAKAINDKLPDDVRVSLCDA